LSTAELLRAALSRRSAAGPTTARRLLDGRAEGLPGWTVDRYGPVALIQSFGQEADPTVVSELTEALSELPSVSAVVLKERGGAPDRAEGRLLHGALPGPHPDDPLSDRTGRLFIDEGEMRLGIDLLYGVNTGLFLDARPMRSWVYAHSRDLRVLNLFSYTAAFGVAAALGGARSTTNVDLVPSALDRGKVNYELNALPVDSRGHVRDDVFEFLRRARKRTATWDLVIVDPPPVPTRGRGRKGKGFDPRRDQQRVIGQALTACCDGGTVLALSAARGAAGFEGPLGRAIDSETRPITQEWIPRDDDFPGPEGLRAVALRVGAPTPQ
jgi:23S rRNA (cytosine1962-C5)-methyltransferase